MIRSVHPAFYALLVSLGACTTTSAKPQAKPLTSWTFVSIDGRAPVAKETSLKIYQGRIAVNVGCNGMGGDLKIEEGRLRVDGLVSTMMYCEGIMEQEQAVAELLRSSPGFFVENGQMGIVSGKHRAELVRAGDD